MNNETILILILGAYFLVFLLCFWFILEDLSIEPETGILITVTWPIALPLYWMWKWGKSRQSITKQYDNIKDDRFNYVTLSEFNNHKEHIEDNRKIYCEGMIDMNERVNKLENIINSVCPHKDTYLQKQTLKELLESNGWSDLSDFHRVEDGVYCVMGNKVSTYQKVCKVCGNVKGITKKQYLTYQKETIESSLKECE